MASQGRSPSGTQQLKLTYMGKPFYGGINSSVPETDIDVNESPFIENCIIRSGEIRSRVPLQPIFPAPSDGFATRGLFCFVDINSVVHTVAITRQNIFQLSVSWPSMLKSSINPWLPISNLGQGQPDSMYSSAVLQTNLIFTNGGTNIFKWNGTTNTVQTLDGLADGTSFGAFYLMELGAKLICAYTIETKAGVTNIFPFRVRWSTTGAQVFNNANPFDPSVNLDAGLTDEFDVPDSITGILPLGTVGYIYRTNGITQMIPNAQGTGFDFDHLWASDRGIGNALPQSLAGFGPMNIFVSGDDVYQLTPNSFQRIGLKAFNSIAADLQNVNGVIQATIIPYFSRGYPYCVYWLIIPDGSGMSTHWLYDVKEQNWTRWVTNGKDFTCRPRLVYVQ